MEISVIVCLLVILLAIWIVSVRKKLAIMDENINHSMNQIGVQLSSLWKLPHRRRFCARKV